MIYYYCLRNNIDNAPRFYYLRLHERYSEIIIQINDSTVSGQPWQQLQSSCAETTKYFRHAPWNVQSKYTPKYLSRLKIIKSEILGIFIENYCIWIWILLNITQWLYRLHFNVIGQRRTLLANTLIHQTTTHKF